MNITRESAWEHCRTCLTNLKPNVVTFSDANLVVSKKLGTWYHRVVTNELIHTIQTISGVEEQSCKTALYPTYICEGCYVKLKGFREFQTLTCSSAKFLNELFGNNPAEVVKTEKMEPFSVTEINQEQLENESLIIKSEPTTDFLEIQMADGELVEDINQGTGIENEYECQEQLDESADHTARMDVSYDSSSDEELFAKSASKKYRFASLLQKYKVLFNRSQVPKIKADKERACIELREDYVKIFGKEITLKQLKKKLQNMRMDIRKKTNPKTAGNNTIFLKEWEQKIWQLMEPEANGGVLKKVPVAVEIIDMDSTKMFRSTSWEESLTSRTKPIPSLPKLKKSTPDFSKLDYVETEETKRLSTSELQRLVLLEQLELIRLQITKENITKTKIKELN